MSNSEVPSVPVPSGSAISPMAPPQTGFTPAATMPTPTSAFLAGIGQSPLPAFQMATYPTPNTAQQLMNMATGNSASAHAGPSSVTRMGGPSSVSPFPFPFPFQGQQTPNTRLRAPSTSASAKGKGQSQGAVNIDDVVRILGEVLKELERVERVWGDWDRARSQPPAGSADHQRADVLLQDLQSSIPFLLSLSVTQTFGALPLPLSLASPSGALPSVPELITYLETTTAEAFQGREKLKGAGKEVLEVLGGK